jgi:predicted RNase H-related nuclease YkuK (DUF458 family)
VSSNLTLSAKYPYGGIGIRNGLRSRTIESSSLSTGTKNKTYVMTYKKLYSGEVVELIDYVKEYMSLHNDVEILIGCDSQNFSDKTIYAIVVALYHRGKGAHVLYNKWKTQREPTRSVRLLNEVWYAVEVAEVMKNSGIPKVKWIDIDINPDPKYKSNEVFRQAVGLVEGMGYEVRYKSLGPIATYAADHLVKL